jgi:putative ABC transport system permease protein
MVFKNLLRRKGRTLLTILGVAVGVAAIVGLGAMADGVSAGYQSMLGGSKADLVLSQPNTMDISLSTVDEDIGDELLAMPEVEDVSPMLMGNVTTDGAPYFFVFGYDPDSFSIQRFQIKQGEGLDAPDVHGKPLLLGSAAAESLKKKVGDTIRLTGSIYRVVGIYETGDGFEEGGAVIRLSDAQELLGKQRQVGLFYVKLKDPSLRERLTERVERRWPDLSLSGTSEFANKQQMVDMLNGFMWGIAALAILIGGVGMMNAQLMSVFERTREIGVLRAAGWRPPRVLKMILGETLVVCLLGGVAGLVLGWLALVAFSDAMALWGASVASIRPALVLRALSVVLTLGLVGGLYPAWRASRLRPVEALRYEGGGGGGGSRFPIGSITVQSLWRRKARTLLTLAALSITIGAIAAMAAIADGFISQITDVAVGSGAEIMLREKNASDTSYSALDERIVDRLAAMPGIESAGGMVLTAGSVKGASIFVVLGYGVHSRGIEHFQIVEGRRIQSNHEIMLGRAMADSLRMGPGDTILVMGKAFRVVGVYETGVSWEETGGVVTLRDGQTLLGRPHKVSLIGVKLDDSSQAEEMVDKINAEFPEAQAVLSGQFAEQMPDMKNTYAMIDGISAMTVAVGGLGIMNTMLMAVLERTREIGVLRALGWRQRRVLSMILKEASLLGVLGGVAGIFLAFGLTGLLTLLVASDILAPSWSVGIFARALMVGMTLGLVGGLYPAWRAARLRPVEALRYE